jgi:class 3 adenylate cyclase
MEHNGEVDPMIPGQKVVAIFGFCNIRHFSETTEVLEEQILAFVNQISEIVHAAVDKYSGAPNKNIGESFLCVWKFRPEDIEFNQEIGNIQPRHDSQAV